jgi:hypothetical protein
VCVSVCLSVFSRIVSILRNLDKEAGFFSWLTDFVDTFEPLKRWKDLRKSVNKFLVSYPLTSFKTAVPCGLQQRTRKRGREGVV